MFGNSAFGKPAGASPFGSFGQVNANTQGQTQPTTGATTGTSLFGGFGNTNANQNPQGQQQQQPGATNSSSNPLFGGKPASSLFGNAASTSGMQPATGNSAPGVGTSLFGGGSAFGAGAQQQQQPATNPFGVSSAAPSTGTGLFGTSATAMPASQSAPSTGLFGQQQTQPSTSAPSPFGQTPNQMQTQPGSTLFGQPAATQPQAMAMQTGGGLFGTFGQSTAAPAPSGGLGLFGNTQPGSSLLGSTSGGMGTSSLFAPKTSFLQPQLREDSAQAQYINLMQRIEAVYQAWDPNSPQNRFQVRSWFLSNLLNSVPDIVLSISSTTSSILVKCICTDGLRMEMKHYGRRLSVKTPIRRGMLGSPVIRRNHFSFNS